MTPFMRSSIFLAATAALLTPSAALGQTFALRAEPGPLSVADAEELEAQARALSAGPDWASAASLYLSAVELRGAGDFERADNLRFAAYILYYEGRAAASVPLLAQAGDAFLTLGDVEGSIGMFIEAAWVAKRIGDVGAALTLGERALLLTRSPLLSEAKRHALLQRIGVPVS
jgi:hypothetical protein